jgi:hypothetical protein
MFLDTLQLQQAHRWGCLFGRDESATASLLRLGLLNQARIDQGGQQCALNVAGNGLAAFGRRDLQGLSGSVTFPWVDVRFPAGPLLA